MNGKGKPSDETLSVQGISKSFGKVKALSNVHISLRAGEVMSVVGENGAGKTTLMNVITGVFPPDEGGIFIEGEKVVFQGPLDALEHGISIVHQEMVNCPNITVAENIFMTDIVASKDSFVNFRILNRKAATALEDFDVKIKPRTKMSRLSVSEQQIVEIAKALSINAKVLIFDEPTASLTEDEVEKLFKIINELKSKGVGILYISHRMDEIFELSDRITVLRDGLFIDTLITREVDRATVISKMIGRKLSEYCPPKSGQIGEPILEIRNFDRPGVFHDISFVLNKHEILGFSGLIGAGRSELMQSIVGLDRFKSGEIHFNGRKLQLRRYAQALNEGIVYLSEDRKGAGLFLRMDVMMNLTLLNLKAISGRMFVRKKEQISEALRYCERMDIKYSSLQQKVGILSGGNQQKIMIGKALSINPKLIIFDEPTRGIDVGSKAEIYRTLRSLADEGVGVIVISSELPEIIGLCDRVCVLYEGELCGEVKGTDINEQSILHIASGL
jgi:ribose transport system ATP-binding protein